MAKLVCSANNKEAGRNARPKILWWALRDSNPEPRDYESPALTVAPRALMNGECNSNKGNSDLISSLHDVKYYHARASRTTQDQVRC